jgi:hypothetical protein
MLDKVLIILVRLYQGCSLSAYYDMFDNSRETAEW